LFYVVFYADKFFIVADCVIVGFFLPEWIACGAEDFVGFAGGFAF
jgi:hypothetical protein